MATRWMAITRRRTASLASERRLEAADLLRSCSGGAAFARSPTCHMLHAKIAHDSLLRRVFRFMKKA